MTDSDTDARDLGGVENFDIARVFTVLEAGVSTPAGMREVLTGTPVEWVVAFEDGGRRAR